MRLVGVDILEIKLFLSLVWYKLALSCGGLGNVLIAWDLQLVCCLCC